MVRNKTNDVLFPKRDELIAWHRKEIALSVAATVDAWTTRRKEESDRSVRKEICGSTQRTVEKYNGNRRSDREKLQQERLVQRDPIVETTPHCTHRTNVAIGIDFATNGVAGIGSTSRKQKENEIENRQVRRIHIAVDRRRVQREDGPVNIPIKTVEVLRDDFVHRIDRWLWLCEESHERFQVEESPRRKDWIEGLDHRSGLRRRENVESGFRCVKNGHVDQRLHNRFRTVRFHFHCNLVENTVVQGKSVEDQ